MAHTCAPNGAWTSSIVTEDDLVLPQLQLPRLTPLIGSYLILTSILASPRGCGPSIDSCQQTIAPRQSRVCPDWLGSAWWKSQLGLFEEVNF